MRIVCFRSFACAVLSFFLCSLSLAGGDSGEVATLPEIRSFDLKTLGELGTEIYRHDQLAWKATDALMEYLGPQGMQAGGTIGWVVDVSGKHPLVRFIRDGEDGLEAAYDIVFKKKVRVGLPKDRKLTSQQLRSFKASRSALEALGKGEHPWCGGNPNFVVLPDPDREGFLVYVLRSKATMDEVPVGGHYRISVSGDGEGVERVDQLFVSCLSLSRSPEELPEGASLSALSMSHLVSRTPLEIHVFLSWQESLPFYVITSDSRMWSVSKGLISEVTQ